MTVNLYVYIVLLLASSQLLSNSEQFTYATPMRCILVNHPGQHVSYTRTQHWCVGEIITYKQYGSLSETRAWTTDGVTAASVVWYDRRGGRLQVKN
jgi:hypothetical protein